MSYSGAMQNGSSLSTTSVHPSGQCLSWSNGEKQKLLVCAPSATVCAALRSCTLKNWLKGSQIWVANGMGYVERFDFRKNCIKGASRSCVKVPKAWLVPGSLKGQVAGSVKGLELFDLDSQSLLASVSLDRFLRIYSTEHRQLQSKCYCKYGLAAVDVLPYTVANNNASEVIISLLFHPAERQLLAG